MKFTATDRSSETARFSREWWLQLGRNLLWVGLITILVWVYADMEFIDAETVELKLLLTTDPSKAMLIDEDGEPLPPEAREATVSFRVRGSRRARARLKRQIEELGSPVRYDISRGRPAEQQDVATEAILADLVEIEEIGLSILSASPAQLDDVPLEPVVRREIPIDPVYVDDDSKPQEFEARPVEVRLSRTKWERIERASEEGKPAFKTAPIDLSDAEPGNPVNRQATISGKIAGIQVVEKRQVPFTATVPERAGPKPEELAVKVNVRILIPPEWAGGEPDAVLQEYSFQRSGTGDPWANLTLNFKGPPEEIRKLGEAHDRDEVHAYVPLNKAMHIDQESAVPWGETVIVRIPLGIDVQLVGQKPEVSFQVEKRGRPE